MNFGGGAPVVGVRASCAQNVVRSAYSTETCCSITLDFKAQVEARPSQAYAEVVHSSLLPSPQTLSVPNPRGHLVSQPLLHGIEQIIY